MSTLAASFLEDLDELDESSCSEREEPVENVKQSMVVEEIVKGNLRKETKYVTVMDAIQRQVSMEEEYQVIENANSIMVQIDDELMLVYKRIVEGYRTKFPELESLVPNPLEYIKVVLEIRNTVDMTLVDLSKLLPSATVMGVSVTGSTTSGVPLTEMGLNRVLEDCEYGLALDRDKSLLLRFVENRISDLAPNVSAIIGTKIAAQLIGLAGGLESLAKMPSCNLQVMGQTKSTLSGFSNASSLKNVGIMYFSDIVQETPLGLRKRALRAVAGKVTLAARVDSTQRGGSNAVGVKFKDALVEKIEKWQEPSKAKTQKALPIPDEKPRRKRGGKRYRKMKERMQLTDVRKEANRMSFAAADNEYGDNAMGINHGRLGAEGSGNLRIVRKEQKSMAKKLKAASYAASNGTSGLASSLAFTPVQGLELINPQVAAERVRKANEKYFGNTSTFQKN